MAQALAANGWRVAVHYHRGQESADHVVESILAAGGEALAVAADLSSQSEAAALFQRIEKSFGPLDCLVNNAGINRDVLLAFMTEEQWDEVIDTNLRATYVCSRLAVLEMMRHGGGSICNIASPSGVRGQAGQCNYAASKGGIIAFTKSLARETARYKITVNCVCPGPTDTPLFQGQPDKMKAALERAIPFRRIAQPQELADAILFFASARSDYVTAQVLSVSGGLTMVG